MDKARSNASSRGQSLLYNCVLNEPTHRCSKETISLEAGSSEEGEHLQSHLPVRPETQHTAVQGGGNGECIYINSCTGIRVAKMT